MNAESWWWPKTIRSWIVCMIWSGALEKTGWNKNKAARLLKLNRTTLVEKIRKRNLDKLMGK